MSNWIIDPLEKITVESMIHTLANVCDGASSHDGSGFNKIDSNFGKSLSAAAKSANNWTVPQATAALKLIRKYQRQLGGKDFIDNWLNSPVFNRTPRGHTTASTLESSKPIRTLTSIESTAVFKFEYNKDIVADVKNIKGERNGKKFWASWDPDNKVWKVPVNETSIEQIFNLASKFEFDIEDRFIKYIEKIKEKTEESKTHLALTDNQHIIVVGDTIMISVADAGILNEFERELFGEVNE